MEWNEDHFDAYLDGAMPPDELRRFEAALNADPALRDELALHRQMRDVIEISALRTALSRIHRAAEAEGEAPAALPAAKKSNSAKPLYRFRIWHAAAAAVLVGVGITLALRMGGAGSNALYSKYYTQDAGLPGMMGGSADYSLDDAMVDYKQGRYGEAIEKLSALQQQGLAGDTAAYYLGMAFLGAEKYEDAGRQLRPLIQKEGPFRPKAAWYSALTDLRLNHKEAAKQALETIAKDSGNPKSSAAAALLSDWK